MGQVKGFVTLAAGVLTEPGEVLHLKRPGCTNVLPQSLTFSNISAA